MLIKQGVWFDVYNIQVNIRKIKEKNLKIDENSGTLKTYIYS